MAYAHCTPHWPPIKGAGEADWGEGRHLALATLLMATLIIVLFLRFSLLFNFAAPFVLDRWLPLAGAEDAAQLKVH